MKLVSQSQAVETIGSQVEPIRRKRKMRRQPRWDRIFLLFVAITFPLLMYWILTPGEKPRVIAQHVVERQDDVNAYTHARIKVPHSNTTETSRGSILKREEVVKESVSKVSADRSDYKSYDKTEVSDRIYNYFRSRGYSHAATIGIMANLKHESQFDPGVHEYGGGPGRGLAQWGGGRFNNLVAYAESKGEHWSDLDTQLEFLEVKANRQISTIEWLGIPLRLCCIIMALLLWKVASKVSRSSMIRKLQLGSLKQLWNVLVEME